MKAKFKQKDSDNNLCNYCTGWYPECNGNVKFGNGYGEDNIIECDEFAPVIDVSEIIEIKKESNE